MRKKQLPCLTASSLHPFIALTTSHPRKEIIEQLIINLSTLGMVLDSESEGIIAQFHLLDDVIGGAPGFYFETSPQFIDCLMMRAIHFCKTMARFAIGSKRLDIVDLLIRQVMASDVEIETAPE